MTIVASGAAIHGAALAEGGARVGVALSGVVPDTFSVRAWEPSPESPDGRRAVLIPLVPAGTATPFVGRRTFSVRGGSSVLPVEVFEGRSEREATRVGEYRMTFPQPMPDGARAEVRLDVRSNGCWCSPWSTPPPGPSRRPVSTTRRVSTPTRCWPPAPRGSNPSESTGTAEPTSQEHRHA
ncbi:MAG: hypothetical protein IPF99_40340 [Deltaproteobacteria bacterium]|nr:hypothetical protein [Deltaproteobacteria bacterium]